MNIGAYNAFAAYSRPQTASAPKFSGASQSVSTASYGADKVDIQFGSAADKAAKRLADRAAKGGKVAKRLDAAAREADGPARRGDTKETVKGVFRGLRKGS